MACKGLRVRKVSVGCRVHKVYAEHRGLRVNRECVGLRANLGLRVDVEHKGRLGLKELQVNLRRYRQFSRLFP